MNARLSHQMAIVLLTVFLLTPVRRALSEVWVVTTTADTPGIYFGNTPPPPPPGSLREAILDSSEGAIIIFAPNVIGTITLTGGTLDMYHGVSIRGPGSSVLTVRADPIYPTRVFNFQNNGNSSLSGLTITGGRLLADVGTNYITNIRGGAGIRLTQLDPFGPVPSLNISDCIIYDCIAFGSPCDLPYFPQSGSPIGGAIAGVGSLTLQDSFLYANAAQGGQAQNCAGGDARGGAVAWGGSVRIARCTFWQNQATSGQGSGSLLAGNALGGALSASGDVVVENGTFTQNATDGNDQGTALGGAVYTLGGASLVNCTLSGNRAVSGSANIVGGGGLYAYFDSGTPPVTLLNTILAGNTMSSGSASVGPDIRGVVSSLGANFIGNADGASGWVAGDILGTTQAPKDPLLGPLADNGGPTWTMALGAGSLAIDAGDDSVLAPPLSLVADQRGYQRRAGTRVDIGAFEAAAQPLLTAKTPPPIPRIAGGGGTGLAPLPGGRVFYMFSTLGQHEAGTLSRGPVKLQAGFLNAALATPVPRPPVITAQPTDQGIVVSGPAAFAVIADGRPPLAYQWQQDGQNVAGATNSLLSLTNVSQADVGGYDVVITNRDGSVTSRVATLTIVVPPMITTQPASRTNVAGTSASFSVESAGSPPLSYFWLHGTAILTNGGNVFGATNSTLTISNLASGDAGAYQAIVLNAAGSMTSVVATLTLLYPPTILTQPQGQAVACGTNVTFSVTVGGSTPLLYQWSFKGTNISGATDATLTVYNVNASMEGKYGVQVSNGAGTTNSDPAFLVLLDTVAYSLRIAPAGTNVVISWPVTCGTYQLEETASPDAMGSFWTAVPGMPMVVAGTNYMVLPIEVVVRFYRLHKVLPQMGDYLSSSELLFDFGARAFAASGVALRRGKAIDPDAGEIRDIVLNATTGLPAQFEAERQANEMRWRQGHGSLHRETATKIMSLPGDQPLSMAAWVTAPASAPFSTSSTNFDTVDSELSAYIAARRTAAQPYVDAAAAALTAAGATIIATEYEPPRVHFVAARSVVQSNLSFVSGLEEMVMLEQPQVLSINAAADLVETPLFLLHAFGAGSSLRIAIVEPGACINDQHQDFRGVTFEKPVGLNQRCTDHSKLDGHSTAVANMLAAIRGPEPPFDLAGLFGGRLFECDTDLNHNDLMPEALLQRHPHFVNYSVNVDLVRRKGIDNAIFSQRLFVANAAGNVPESGSRASGYCYNSVCVGGYDHYGTIGVANFGDDTWDQWSSWQNDDTGREKPDLVGPFAVRTASWQDNNGYSDQLGTSFATPAVVGLAALLTANFPRLFQDPTLLRAVLLASASHPMRDQATDPAPATIPIMASGKDYRTGAGAPRGDRGAQIMSSGSFMSGFLDADTDFVSGYLATPISFGAAAGETVRIVLTYDNPPINVIGDLDALLVDLDLVAFEHAGSLKRVMHANPSAVNNIEIIEFVAPRSEIIDVRLRKARWETATDGSRKTHVAVAWDHAVRQ